MNKKSGLDYFSFDIDFFNDEKIQFVSALYGTKGEAITIRLLCRVYRNGYFLNWNEDMALLFAKSVGDNISSSLVNDVVKELLKRGFFNETIFKSFSILTSRGIQNRYFEATLRRKNVEYNPEYILIDLSKYTNLKSNVDTSTQNANISNQDVDILKQSKVKESKVKESKVNKKETLSKNDCFVEFGKYANGDNALLQALKDFYIMRDNKKPKKTIATQGAIKLLFDSLDRLTQDNNEKVKILEESILCCWDKVFPLKNVGKSNSVLSEVEKAKQELEAGFL